jgi:hypothetical protein
MPKYDFIQYLDDNEECKELKDYPGYFITTKGRVWSTIRKTGKWLSLYKQDKYYYGVTVAGGNKLIHQLVGRNFLPEYKQGLCILHKDESLPYPEINYIENLYVGTKKDNTIDRNLKNRGIHRGKSHLSTNQVQEIRKRWIKSNNSETMNYFSTRICGEYGVSRNAINSIIRNKTWIYVD